MQTTQIEQMFNVILLSAIHLTCRKIYHFFIIDISTIYLLLFNRRITILLQTIISYNANSIMAMIMFYLSSDTIICVTYLIKLQ